MKIAITGKGGVGKTTLAAIMCRLYAAEGHNVLAVDADPDANLALALGFGQELIDEIVPIVEMKDLVSERTNSEPGGFGVMFKLNPKVDDIPEMYCKQYSGVKLLTMGASKKGGGGCLCPENVLLKRLMSHLVVQSTDIVILDMEAGIEHLGRGTAESVDAFIVVVEPGLRSIQTYRQIKKLARDIGIEKVFVVANKIKNETDRKFILENTDSCLGFISYTDDVVDSDRNHKSPYDVCETIVSQVKTIKEKLS